MRHLQQLDGLHQLWCHHQRLVLAQEKIGRQCHSGRETPVRLLRETASCHGLRPRKSKLAQKLLFYSIWSSGTVTEGEFPRRESTSEAEIIAEVKAPHFRVVDDVV